MRPIKLIMSAFGSYSGKVTIDFEKLGENGIYLISGNTGSGKTTIFDAISFALFGKGSGDNRDSGKLFRSEYASAKTATYVELEFTCGDKLYKIKRSPEYERAKQRGEGTTIDKYSAELTLPDGKVFSTSKIAEIDEKIKEILGIDREQFSRIVMLPQGSFMKFLLAKTQEKGEIFRKIFGTYRFVELQERLGKLEREYRSSAETERQFLCSAVNELKCCEDSAHLEKLEALKDTVNDENIKPDSITDGISTMIDEIEGESKERIKDIISKLDINEKKKLRFTKMQQEHESNNKLKNSIKEKQDVVADCNNKLPKLAAVLEEAKKQAESCQELFVRSEKIREQLSDYEKLDRINAEVKTTSDEHDRLKADIDKTGSDIDKTTLDIKKHKKQIDDLSGCADEIIRLNVSCSEIEKRLEYAKKCEVLVKRYGLAQKTLSKEQTAFGKLSDEYKKANDNYITLEKLYDSAIAGILAEKLTNGERCPVCGSCEHPSLAVKPESTPTDAELEAAKTRRDEAQESKNRQLETTSKANRDLENVRSQLYEEAENLGIGKADDAELSGMILKEKADISSQLEDIRQQISNAEKDKKLRDELENNVKSLEKLLEEKTASLNEKTTEFSAVHDQLTQLSADRDSIKLDHSSKADAEKAINELLDKKTAIEKALTKAQNDLNECERQKGEAAALIEETQKQMTEPEIDEENLRAALSEINSAEQELLDKKSLYDHICKNNADKKKTIESRAKKLTEYGRKYASTKELADLANGKIRDSEHIKLEVYVQMMYFERMLMRANRYLLGMTGGQYELERTCTEDGRRKAGLDLNIFDHYNRKSRDVKTLSGGECFKASLALAFGMAEEIRENAGGITIDTMFIDEGFGSLDSESLDQAINTLYTLSQSDSNRLIGIISHVADLKNRIEKKIIVEKTVHDGSRVTIFA